MSDDSPDNHEPSAPAPPETDQVPATPESRAKLFDSIFKKLMMESSHPAVVRFINGLFWKDHPTDSKVHATPVESVKDDLSKNFTDMVITIGDSDKYVIEAQTGNDNAMAYRILDYSVQKSLVKSGETAYTATLFLPPAVVLYWEPTRNTPDSLTIQVVAPDGNTFAYQVPTFKLPEHAISELEERNLTLLLPFYALKCRKRLGRAKTEGKRLLLADEMKVIVRESTETLKRSRQNRLLTSEDASRALAYLKRIYHYSYTRHKEFEEMNATLNETYLTEVDFLIAQAEKDKQAARLEERKEIARSLILESWSTEKIAKITKLDVAEVETLRREMLALAM
jgi:hypothetical protein